jgi:hypothetical protein
MGFVGNLKTGGGGVEKETEFSAVGILVLTVAFWSETGKFNDALVFEVERGVPKAGT